MGAEKGELPWVDIRFKSEIQLNHSFDMWGQQVLALSVVSKKVNEVRVKKAIT